MPRRPPIESDEIICYIVDREQNRQPLNSSIVQRNDPSLFNAARRRFGSWPRALQAAGLDPQRFCRSRAWTPQRIINCIRRLNVKGHSLRRRDVARFDQGLLAASHILFGSWQLAIEAAGIDSSEYCLQAKWAREQVIEGILLRAVKLEPLGSTTVHPQSLRTSAVAHFGSWANALRSAGLEPKDHIGAVARNSARPTFTGPDEIKKALLQRHALGLPCNQSALRRQDRRLFRAVHRVFGSCRRAEQYAGIAQSDPG